MDLGLSEEQEMLRRTARELLEKECPKALVRDMEEDEKGYSPELWQKFAEQGFLGLPFSEEYGGTGFGFLDLMVLVEEFGRALVPGPYFYTVVLSGMAISEFGTEEQKKEYLPKIADGQAIMTFAHTEPSGRWDAGGVSVTGVADGDDFVLNGVKLFVPDAHVSDYLLVTARTKESDNPEDGITVFLVDAKTSGISYEVLKTIASDKQCEVVLEDVRVPRSNVLGEVDRGWPVVDQMLRRGAVGKCAEMVGNSQQVLEMTVEYAKTRVQFGRPIGSFQAIQHHCANMATDVDGSRFITYQAAWRLSEDMPCDREVSMAKAWVSEACRRVAALGHQVHGGIGFTKEHDMQLFFRRAKQAELFFGDADYHKEKVAQAIGL
ncbi:MAG: acyl-CoA/acyl-ACP dehydrogenase [Chloroflexi bacterium]|nr:acyl-CoA/acyl-ACP dehydrogenase [Chloroflexota bacterium]